MVESATSSNPLCTDAGRAKKLKVDREASLFEDPGIVENVIAYLGIWKLAYIARQKDWFAMISKVLLALEERIQNDCLSQHVFHNGINQLKALDITYDDIYSFFFSKKLNVIFTMLGLYYAYFFFHIHAEELKKAMSARGVIGKVVCARWMIPRTCSFGFYMPEENYMRVYSLGQVVENQMSVLWLMRQSYKNFYAAVPTVTLSYKIPEPLNCMAQDEN